MNPLIKTGIGTTLATLTVAALSLPAQALTFFTDRTAWENALNALTTVRSISPTETFDNSIPAASTITFNNGVVSEGINGTIGNSVGSGRYLGSVEDPNSLGTTADFDSIVWTFPEKVLAFGADWNSTSTATGLQVQIGSETVVFANVPGFTGTGLGSGFLGFIADSPFESIVFSGVGNNTVSEGFSVDNLAFASAKIPEPSTLIGLFAVASLGFAARKRKG